MKKLKSKNTIKTKTKFMGFLALMSSIGLVFSRNALANDLQYATVPTAHERSLNPDYQRFPTWSRIEIVSNGMIDRTHENVINQEGLSDLLGELEWLQVREFDLNTMEIHFDGPYVYFPFSVGVRFQEKGIAGSIVQGTINSLGEIQVEVSDGKIQQVRLNQFDDSSHSERLGRQLGILDHFNQAFLKQIVIPTLKNFLEAEQNQMVLQSLIDHEQLILN